MGAILGLFGTIRPAAFSPNIPALGPELQASCKPLPAPRRKFHTPWLEFALAWTTPFRKDHLGCSVRAVRGRRRALGLPFPSSSYGLPASPSVSNVLATNPDSEMLADAWGREEIFQCLHRAGMIPEYYLQEFNRHFRLTFEERFAQPFDLVLLMRSPNGTVLRKLLHRLQTSMHIPLRALPFPIPADDVFQSASTQSSVEGNRPSVFLVVRPGSQFQKISNHIDVQA